MPLNTTCRMLTLATVAGLAALTLTAAGCGGSNQETPTASGMALLTGTVTGEPLVAIPFEAITSIRLLDMSATPPRLIGEQFIAPTEQFPITFMVTYDRANIDPAHTYALQATIRTGQTVIWSSAEPTPVLTQGHPDKVEIVVEPTR